MNRLNITPSTFTYSKNDFLDAEEHISGNSHGPITLDAQKIVNGIHFVIKELNINISGDNILKDIYFQLKNMDDFAYNGIANKINDILGFEETSEYILKQKNEKLRKYANIDSLTNITNRRKFDRLFKSEVGKGEIFSILFFDLDYFKFVNDTYGHISGDLVLKEVAKNIKKKIKKSDVFARYGGEEFIIMLPGTDISGGEAFSERIRKLIENLVIIDESGKEIKVTISIGVVERNYSDSVNSLLKRADDALYKAKNSGRNKVVFIKE